MNCILRTALPIALALVSGLEGMDGARAADGPIAIQAARIVTAEGDEIAGGTILVESGRIQAIGNDIVVPPEAQLLRFPDGVVLPGLVHPHTTAGLRVVNENLPDVPYISVLDGIDPNVPEFRAALRGGVTTLHVIPGNATRFGGQGAVLRPVGALPEAMAVKSPSALKISLAPPSGETRMAHMAQLRRTFDGLHTHLTRLLPPPPAGLLSSRPATEAELAALIGAPPDWKSLDWDRIPRDKIEEQRRPLADLVRGILPAFLYCPRAADVFKAFELMDAHNIRATLILGPDGYKAVPLLIGRSGLGPVVIDPDLVQYEENPETGDERRILAARAFHDAGIPFAIQTRDERGGGRGSGQVLSRDPASVLWYQAIRLAQQGIPRADAVRAATIHPARALGLDHRLGSLAKGKDANLVVFSGDPFDARSWVDLVVIEGRTAYRRDEDPDLRELLRRPERKF